METNELRSARIKGIQENRANRQAERQRMATAFREELVRELGGTVTEPSRQALLDSAVAARLIVAEVSSQFVRAQASSKSLTRLQLAAGVLRRSLKALGLTEGAKKPAPTPAAVNTSSEDRCPPNLNEAERRVWAQDYVRRRAASVTEKVNE